MTKRVAVLAGDGVGPEVTAQAVKILDVLAHSYGISMETEEALFGGVAFDSNQSFCPEETVAAIERADAILLGAIGGPSWERGRREGTRDKRGLLWLRKNYGLFANLRPIRSIPELIDVSPLKRHIIEGVDLLILRELVSGLYFGEPRGDFDDGGEPASRNAMVYRQNEVDRIVRMGFEQARSRRRRLHSIDKANVLDVSKFWRRRVEQIATEFEDVELGHYYIDVAAMHLVANPLQFDCIVTGNLFGDILSDEASVLMGSLGLLPSASIGPEKVLYEPVHGSAPDIAGQNVANPLGAIFSVGMMCRYTFSRPDLEERVFAAARVVLRECRTTDIMEPGRRQISCDEMGDRVAQVLADGSDR